MLDKEKLKAKREKEMAESVDVWQSLLGAVDAKKEEPKTENKDNRKK